MSPVSSTAVCYKSSKVFYSLCWSKRGVLEPYTVREARIHLRHVRELLKGQDLADGCNGVDGASVTFLSTINMQEQNKAKESKPFEGLPPEHALPGVKVFLFVSNCIISTGTFFESHAAHSCRWPPGYQESRDILLESAGRSPKTTRRRSLPLCGHHREATTTHHMLHKGTPSSSHPDHLFSRATT